MTITIHVNPTDTAKEFDRAIEWLKRMRKEMFKPVPKAIAKAMKRKR
jgi:hypothetical protein